MTQSLPSIPPARQGARHDIQSVHQTGASRTVITLEHDGPFPNHKEWKLNLDNFMTTAHHCPPVRSDGQQYNYKQQTGGNSADFQHRIG